MTPPWEQPQAEHEYQVAVLHCRVLRAADATEARELVLDELARLCDDGGKGLTVRVEELS